MPHPGVVGVIQDFGKDGEIAWLGNYVFDRDSCTRADPPRCREEDLLVKVRPGTPVALGDACALAARGRPGLVRRRQDPSAEPRNPAPRLRLAPLAFLGLVGLFLLLMVVLGLTGVVWQNVTRRTREIGLRRAKGSTAGSAKKSSS